jgi:hypothetical protein
MVRAIETIAIWDPEQNVETVRRQSSLLERATFQTARRAYIPQEPLPSMPPRQRPDWSPPMEPVVDYPPTPPRRRNR